MTDNNYSFKHVLLVDDSEIDILVNRRLMELTRFSSGVTATESGKQALEFLLYECDSQSKAPDWIFLDMYLPGMNGLEFIEAFKSLPEYITGKTKIIILSVFQKQEALKSALSQPFVAGQLEKPLTQQALRSLAAGEKPAVNASF